MSRGQRETLAQRVANTRAREAAARSPASAEGHEGAASTSGPPVQHCWYDGPHGRQAALLLEWRQRAGAWAGRIAVSVPDDQGWALVEMWVDAGLLAPVEDTADP